MLGAYLWIDLFHIIHTNAYLPHQAKKTDFDGFIILQWTMQPTNDLSRRKQTGEINLLLYYEEFAHLMYEELYILVLASHLNLKG